MNRQEFNRAFVIAADKKQEKLPDAGALFDGFGLPDFKPVKCTLRQVAELMRWQAGQLNGEWDMTALQEIADHGRHKFEVIGNDSADSEALRQALLEASCT